MVPSLLLFSVFPSVNLFFFRSLTVESAPSWSFPFPSPPADGHHFYPLSPGYASEGTLVLLPCPYVVQATTFTCFLCRGVLHFLWTRTGCCNSLMNLLSLFNSSFSDCSGGGSFPLPPPVDLFLPQPNAVSSTRSRVRVKRTLLPFYLTLSRPRRIFSTILIVEARFFLGVQGPSLRPPDDEHGFSPTKYFRFPLHYLFGSRSPLLTVECDRH